MNTQLLQTAAGLLVALLSAASICHAQSSSQPRPNLLVNGGFETPGDLPDQPAAGWEKFWARQNNQGSAAIDSAIRHSGSRSLHIDFRGQQDWSIGTARRITVASGQLLRLGGWIRADKLSNAQLGITSFDAAGNVLEWSMIAIDSSGTHDWQELARVFIVPEKVTALQVRFVGNGPGAAWLDDVSLTSYGDRSTLQAAVRGKTLVIDNGLLSVRLNAAGGTLAVTDKRTGQTWQQQQPDGSIIVTDARATANSLRLSLLAVADDLRLTADIALPPDRAELHCSIDGQGKMSQLLAFPAPFVTGPHTWIVLPLNEGIIYPADDQSVGTMSLACYGGRGLCMPWYGVTAADADDTGHGTAGVMTLVETPDDARADLSRKPATGLFINPGWESTRGQFGYARKLTWVFLSSGGYPAMAQWYRQVAQSGGLAKTLARKQAETPQVDRLIGAANVWNWDLNPVALCRQMKSLGMDRVLWSRGAEPKEIDAINELGYLTSTYDIYQDVWPPGKPTSAPHDGWPDDLVLLPDGAVMPGWAQIQKNPDGTSTTLDGGVICSSRQLIRASKRIPIELKTHAYGCRFLDTTTASPWRECWNPAHPLSRSDDRKHKMALLDYCGRECGLVVGSETGIDSAVPYVSYFEGMMSLGPYRLPGAGRLLVEYESPTDEFLKYQLGARYRIPLWELVYHDCVVSDWYWGDSSNKLPEMWDRRDLFNILYATPPVFVFDRTAWAKLSERFVRSYKSICPLARRLGNAQMLLHEFLTADHTVQATTWSDGTRITVNLGDKPYATATGGVVTPMGHVVESSK